MRRHFLSLRLLGKAPGVDNSLPLILISNHSSWWDGFFVHLLNERLFQRPAYLMMLERQLSKYRFFARVGAYSINPQNPKSIISSLMYTVKLLDNADNPLPMICIFPQGELEPWGKRPLQFKRGIDWIIRAYKNPINLLPLAMRIEHTGEQLPEAFFLFGENMIVASDNFPGIHHLEQVETELLSELNRLIAKQECGTTLLGGRKSVNIRMEHWGSKRRLKKQPEADR